MTGPSHWFIRSVFTTAALSNAALAIWAFFPTVSTILLMPYGIEASDPRAWLVAVAAQVIFTVLVMIGRWCTKQLALAHPRIVVVSVIIAAGAIRGAVVVWGSALITATDASALEVSLRAVNSAVIALPALGLAGVIVQFTRDYRRDYAQLRDRAMRLQQEVTSPTQSLSDSTIASWVGVQRSLRFTADAARDRLADDELSAHSLNATADVIAETLTTQVRPISHGLWLGSTDEPPRLRAHVVAWDALRPWAPPVMIIAILTAVVTGISAVNRVGVIPGLAATVVISSAVTVALGATAVLGRRFPSSHLIGLATIALTLPFVLALAVVVSVLILRSPPDLTGSFVLGFAITVGVGGAAFMRRVIVEREALLTALQARIDAQALDVLAKRAGSDTWGRSLGTFVHHSVQSELTALRMQLMGAASTEDDSQRAATRADTLARFDRLLALAPPWVNQRSGRDVVSEVAHAWAGIATVDISTTDAGTDEQWAIASYVVEEGVANAVRAGCARHVRVEIDLDEEDSLLITIDDDGRGFTDQMNPGLGTWWLDQVAPGAWERSSSDSGTQLIVRVR